MPKPQDLGTSLFLPVYLTSVLVPRKIGIHVMSPLGESQEYKNENKLHLQKDKLTTYSNPFFAFSYIYLLSELIRIL